jgi:esterase/lipase
MFKKKPSIFLVHGFLESANETYGEFLEKLDNKKYTYQAVDLVGHGDDEYKNFKYKDCITDVVNKYEEFVSSNDDIILIGFSMGGVIASYLATIHKPKKLILLSPAFQYVARSQMRTDVYSITKGYLKHIQPNIFDFLSPEQFNKDLLEIINSTFSEDVIFKKVFEMNDNIGFDMLLNFMLLVEDLKRKIKSITCDTLVYHGELDELVPIQASLEIYRKIDTRNKRLIILPKVYHRLMQSSLRHELHNEIFKYIKK